MNDSAQVNSIASIVKTYGWRKVVPIYEDTDYGRGIMPFLVDALQEVDARVPLASPFFIKAKEVGMMNKGYAWIVTDGVTNLIDSLNSSVLASLNGALGVEFFVPKSRELDDFTMRWNMRFQIDNPTAPPLKLSIFGLWSYDTIWAVAQALPTSGDYSSLLELLQLPPFS